LQDRFGPKRATGAQGLSRKPFISPVEEGIESTLFELKYEKNPFGTSANCR